MAKSKNMLVTGGAGFLGSNLIRRLLSDTQDLSIVCVDNLQTGSLKKLGNLIDHQNFKFLEQDIIENCDVQIDGIWNLACAASPPAYQADPIHTLKTSVIGVLNLAELARTQNVPILHTSTSEVYGDPLVDIQSEDYWGNVNPIGKRSCYDEGKRAAETLLFDYSRIHQLNCKVVRIFNTYGPGMSHDDGRVVSNFIVQALKGSPITIYGDGTQTRSFCYVDDMIDGFVKMFEHQHAFTGPINLGNPIEFTMLELADLVLDLCGSNSDLEFQPLPDDDPKQRKPDISKAKSELDWEPKVSLKDGLIKTITYFDATMP